MSIGANNSFLLGKKQTKNPNMLFKRERMRSGSLCRPNEKKSHNTPFSQNEKRACVCRCFPLHWRQRGRHEKIVFFGLFWEERPLRLLNTAQHKCWLDGWFDGGSNKYVGKLDNCFYGFPPPLSRIGLSGGKQVNSLFVL